MKIKLDWSALQEDLRRLGVGLMLAGLVGTFVRHVAPAASISIAALGLLLVAAGVIRKEAE